ncbi:MAG: Stp1/IreP family PP2C-type Ser/Thr phosphatase [Candidatus Riflebacteria bacterium]|nr:Stp1/IreP family PP2C-type Ser/Thr phosphatase [Candidatus Riflebacteria bacterium]
MHFLTISDRGLVRSNNEDYVEGVQIRWSGPLGKVQDITALLLADGMGGAAAGEFASMLAVRTTKDKLFEGILNRPPEELLHTDLAEFLGKCFRQANEAIYQKSRENIDMEGMGTTIVAALIHEGIMTIGHVGDSRAYMLIEGNFRQITRDHSFVQELVDQGKITPEQAKQHPNRNVITRALGVSAEVEPDCKRHELQKGDLLMICSDGLTGFAEDLDIARICKDAVAEKPIDLSALGNKLIELAKIGGGGDNVSVALYYHDPKSF